jgi:hypothetical protein
MQNAGRMIMEKEKSLGPQDQDSSKELEGIDIHMSPNPSLDTAKIPQSTGSIPRNKT